jgi:negative regulator of flagellin synthesis FlgM
MANKIDGLGQNTGAVPNLVTERMQNTQPVTSIKQASSNDSSQAEQGSTVNLTDAGRHIQHLEQLAQQSSGVDMSRVEHIRAQLADGSYQIDASRIADGMLRMERALSDKL